MKFGKQIKNEAVPEWREKYFNYRIAKKKLKVLASFNAEALASSASIARTPSATSRTPLVVNGNSSHVSLPASLRLPEPALSPAELRARRSRTEEDNKRQDFVDFLHHELVKIDEFHVQRENEAQATLEELKLNLDRLSKEKGDHKNTGHRGYWKARSRIQTAIEDFHLTLGKIASYASLNTEAFRKINKKYDKTLKTKRKMAFFSRVVKPSRFANSNKIRELQEEVVDLYADNYKDGNRSAAVKSLQGLRYGTRDFDTIVFFNGFFLALGAVFGITGLVKALTKWRLDPDTAEDTSFLLQLYAGYFLIILLFVLFDLACIVWVKARINYQFIFELDERSRMHWKQYFAGPLACWALLGFTMWCNFVISPREAFEWWPAGLTTVLALLLVTPLKHPYGEGRVWLARAMYRLCLAPFTRVYFQDIVLGDMACSLTYATGNIAMFWCLTGHRWQNPQQCASTYSVPLGVMTTIPGLLRFFQCARRLHDSKYTLWWPQGVNALKYAMTIAYYGTLSAYRIERTQASFIIFIVFSFINAAYCSAWDVMVDWSLGHIDVPHKGLRETLIFRRASVYYVAIVLDVILRFSWVLYAIDAGVFVEHSSVVSFAVSLGEVFRRGMWVIFRVENEHVGNMRQLKAYHDLRLPFHGEDEEQVPQDPSMTATTPSSTQRTPRQRFADAIARAHTEDYELREREWSDDEEDGADSGSDA